MGYVNLPRSARSVLNDIARLSYGSGLFEGRNGGRGRMGLVTAGNVPRVIKFNTHYHDRGPLGDRQSAEMLESSNQLRELLCNLARRANLPEQTLNDIRHRLELDKNKPPKSLLERKVVAKVVQRIGGNEVWEAIEGERNLERFRTKDVATSFADMTGRGQSPNAASIRVNGLKSLDSFAGKKGDAFRKIVGQELDELEAFCAANKWDERRIGDLRDICKRLLDEKAIFPKGSRDEFKFVFEQDIRRAVRQTAARLIVLQDGNDVAAGMALASKYLRNGRKGLVMRGLGSDGAFFGKIMRLRNDMAKVCGGKEFTVRLLNSIFRNEMLAKDPVSSRNGNYWSDLGFAPGDRPGSLSQAEQRALEDVLTGLAKDVRSVLGNDFRLADFARLGMSFRELKKTLADFSKSFHLSDSEGRRYGQLAGTWLRNEVARNLRSDGKGGCGTPEFAENLRRKLMSGVPLCNVGGGVEEKSGLVAKVGDELFHPVGGEGENLCGTVRVDGELIPLWRPVERTMPGELKLEAKQNGGQVKALLTRIGIRNGREPQTLSEIVCSKISKIADGRPLRTKPGPRGEKLLKCCMAAGRDFLRLYVRKPDLQNVACHREFFLGENGKLQYRISAVVEGRTLLARFQLEDDGLMTCQRLLNADERGVGAMTQEEKKELAEVQAWHKEFKSEMDEIEEDYSVPRADRVYENLPFEEEDLLTAKEQKACELADEAGNGGNPMVYYNRLRDNPDPPEIPVSESEIKRVQDDFNAWAEGKRTDTYAYGGWQFFDFPGKNGSKGRGQPYKLYLTMPGTKVRDLRKEDFQRVHKALSKLNAKNDFKVKFSSNIKDWPHMTDQVCCYFETQQDLDAAVKALNAAQKHSEHAFLIESGQDVELQTARPVCGCDMDGREITYDSISYTGLLALRIWIAKCLGQGKRGRVPMYHKSEFLAALKLLKKIDGKGLTEKDRMLLAYVFRFLFVRYGLPVKLKPKAAAPALLNAAA